MTPALIVVATTVTGVNWSAFQAPTGATPTMRSTAANTVIDVGQDPLDGRWVPRELVGDDDSRLVANTVDDLAQECWRCCALASLRDRSRYKSVERLRAWSPNV